MAASTIFCSNLLKDKNVVVTGGGSGIGRVIVEECHALGASLAIGARKQGRLDETVAAITADGGDIYGAPLDIRDHEAVDAWVDAIAERWGGRIDVLVNNAGGQFPSPAVAIPPKGWRAVIETNLTGTWFMTQAVAKKMMATGGGRIINIVANMWRGFPGMAHTGAARAGVVNLTKSLSLEWAQHNILVNSVAPGVIRSSGLDTYPAELRESIETEIPKHIPLKRLGTMEDVAWAVAYLASPAGAYITGETLCVDGGQAHWGTVFPV